MVRFSRVRLAAMLMCPPSGIRGCTLMRHNGGNTLQSQDHHEGLRALPLKAMECGVVDRYAALLHEFFHMSIAQGVGHVPSHTHENDVLWEMGSLEADRHHRSPSLRTIGHRERPKHKSPQM